MTQGADSEFDLSDYLAILRRRWPWLLGTIVVVGALVVAFTLLRSREYESQAQVLLLTDSTQSLFPFDDSVEAQVLRDPIAELQYVSSQDFRDEANRAAGGPSGVTASLVLPEGSNEVEDSDVIRVVAVASDAERARAAAQAYADTYVRVRNEQDLATATQNAADNEVVLDRLAEQRAELLLPVLELRAERNAETDPEQRADLDLRLAELEAGTQPLIDSLTNQIAQAALRQGELDRLVHTLEGGLNGARLQNAAFASEDPVSPDITRNLLIGALAALVLGLVVAALRDFLDTRTRDQAEAVRLADLPVLGSIPRHRGAAARRFADLPDREVAAYRLLLNSLWLCSREQPIRSVAITSTHADGATTDAVVNMAMAEASRGVRVLVIDADFARPSLAARLGVPDDPDRPGLADVLGAERPGAEAITATDIDNLDLLDTGDVDVSAPDLLRSDRLRAVLDGIGRRYNLVLIQAPPTLGLVDARLIASSTDGAIVLYDAADTERADLVNAVTLLRSSRVTVLGLVATQAGLHNPVQVTG